MSSGGDSALVSGFPRLVLLLTSEDWSHIGMSGVLGHK
jgi:hypothetical protein